MKNIDWKLVGIYAFMVFLILIVIAGFGTMIYCFIVYGNSPVDEIPAWALKFMDIFGGK